LFVLFCERVPHECAVDPSEASTVNVTEELWEALLAVNYQVNTQITPITDELH
jgi:predicted transglutaminase-like cysteine proteinase